MQNRYRILGLLGQGGMGAVYLAEGLRLPGRRCAIKENVPDPTPARRSWPSCASSSWPRPASSRGWDHPNLTKVSNYFTQGGNEYLVMDYVEGENLQSVLDRLAATVRPLPESLVLALVRPGAGCAGLFAQPAALRHHPPRHQAGQPHPDLPGQGQAGGLWPGQAVGPQRPGTATVVKGFGTPEYAALEQHAQGAYGHTDARTDIYALGATLYHLLTGAPPPDARPGALHRPGIPLPPPHEINPAVSPHVEAAILKALEVHPKQRFQSAP